MALSGTQFSFFKILFIYFIFGCSGSLLLRGLFSSCGEQGLPCLVGHGLLISVASRVQSMGSREQGFSICGSWALEHGLSSCDARAWLLHSIWDLPGSGIEPLSPSLVGGFFTSLGNSFITIGSEFIWKCLGFLDRTELPLSFTTESFVLPKDS